MIADLILARAEMLCLLRALHVARRDHKASRSILAALVQVRARVAAMEGRG